PPVAARIETLHRGSQQDELSAVAERLGRGDRERLKKRPTISAWAKTGIGEPSRDLRRCALTAGGRGAATFHVRRGERADVGGERARGRRADGRSSERTDRG